MNSRVIFVLGAIGAAALTRILPHPWNFTPMVGMTLFGAMKLEKRWMSFLVPMLAMIISDIFVNALIQTSAGGFSYFFTKTALAVYTAFGLVALIGQALRKYNQFHHIVLASALSSFVFYLTSNTIDFINNPFYEQSVTGYYACMIGGLAFYPNAFGPFFGSFFFNQVLGDFFYTGLLFGAYSLVTETKAVYKNA